MKFPLSKCDNQLKKKKREERLDRELRVYD
jgi:hypothetical protein